MKKTFVKFAALAAVCVLGFASCEIAEPENPVSGNDAIEAEGDFSVTFNCVLDEPTKTEYHDKTIWWSAGDMVRFFQRYYKTEDATAFTNTYKDSNATASGTFCPTLSFNTPAKFPVHYMAFYPSASYAGNLKAVNGRLVPELSIPSTQSPSLLSFDPAADLLISEYIEADAARTNFDLRFKRMVALGKMKISGVDSSSPVVSVKFSAVADGNSVHLAGKSYYNIYEGNVYQESTYATAIVASYSDASAKADGDGMTVFFNCRPFELGEGDTFKVVVTTSDEATFTKEVTIPSGKSLEFVAGNGTVFSVDMSTAAKNYTWVNLSASSTAPTVTTAYSAIFGTNLSEVKYVSVAKSDFAAIASVEEYIDANGTALSTPEAITLSSGKTLTTSGVIDTEYVLMVKAVDTSSRTAILTREVRTDWFKLALVTRSSGGVQIQITAKELATGTKAYRVVPSSSLAGVTDLEGYYLNTLKPGGLASSTITTINGKDAGVSANFPCTTDYTGAALVSGGEYTVMIQAKNERGEVVFRTAKASAK